MKKKRHIDKEPFKNLVEHEEQSLEVLHERYARGLYAYVLKFITDDEALVKDVIAETWVVVWKKRKRVARLDNPERWVFKVAKLLARYRIRDEYRYSKTPVDAYLDLQVEEAADQELERKELEDMIYHITQRLPPKEREIFIQSKLEGKSHEELMQQHGIAEQTVKNHLSRALRKVRAALGKLMTLML